MFDEQQLRLGLDECPAGIEYRRGEVALTAAQVDRELRAYGHEGHDVNLDRVAPHFGDPDVLRLTFWCETCHVAQVVLLPRPGASAA